jgi:hypothetical protein
MCLFAGGATLTGFSQQAYWVVESNVRARDKATVKVYDLGNQLIAEREINGSVDIRRKRDKRMLNRIMRESVKEHERLVARKARKATRI